MGISHEIHGKAAVEDLAEMNSRIVTLKGPSDLGHLWNITDYMIYQGDGHLVKEFVYIVLCLPTFFRRQ